MAAITSAAAGNWSATATWTGGVVPGNGDTVILTKSVTVDVNVTVGASNGQYVSGTTPAAIQLNTGGRLILAAGKKLTVRGDLAINTGYNIAAIGLTMGAGSILEFDSSATSPTTTGYRFLNLTTANQPGFSITANGTQAAPCYIQSNAGGANARMFANGFTSALGGLNCTYTVFQDLGTATVNAIESAPNPTASPVNLTNCTFLRCGLLHLIGTPTASGYMNVTNVIFKDGLNANYDTDFCWYAAFKSCVFGKNAPMQNGNYTGASFDTCFFQAGFPTTGGTAYWTLFVNNFIRFTVASGFNSQGDMTKCLILADHNTANCHWLVLNKTAAQTLTDLIFDHVDTDGAGDTILSPVAACSTATTYTMRKVIVLPNAGGDDAGTAFTIFGTGVSANANFDYQHSTYFSGSQGATFNETGSCAVGQLLALKNNIAWDLPATAGRGFVLLDTGHQTSSTGLVTDAMSPANGDYNNRWNLALTNAANATSPWYTYMGRGYAAAFSSMPGVHDYALNPQFVDISRNTALFDTLYLQNVAGSTWASHASTDTFAVGDIVSNNNSGYYGWAANNTINFRCIQAHTKSATGSEPGLTGANWRAYWELASVYRLRSSMVAAGAAGPAPTYTDASLGLVNADAITLLRTWITKGLAPQNTSLRGAASDGADIGAIAVVGASQAMTLLGCG